MRCCEIFLLDVYSILFYLCRSSCFQLQENVNLFCQTRNNIINIMNGYVVNLLEVLIFWFFFFFWIFISLHHCSLLYLLIILLCAKTKNNFWYVCCCCCRLFSTSFLLRQFMVFFLFPFDFSCHSSRVEKTD